ncbi:DMT family transporter [Actinomadura sp. 9N215]|uniref:DMT family transporter n=1 Tax=Actinomadura sp. 9N215 TaxID=3375150 RepID=UPI0037ABE3B4
MSAGGGPATSSGRGGWRAGLLFGGVGMVCFSGTAPATRVAVPVFGAATVTCARIVIAAVLGAVTLAATGRLRWPGHRDVGGLLVMGIGLAVGYPLFLALAVDRVPAYHGAVVIGLTPAATAAIAAVRAAERPGSRFWLASVVGLVTVVVFALGQSGGGLQLADALLAAAVVSCAIGYVEGARTARRIGAVSALCWAMILLLPVAGPFLAWLATRDYPPVPASAWAGLGYAGVASMFAGSLAWYHGLSTGGTARIGQLNLAQPFLAIVWSAVLVGEHITWAVPATAAVIVACMAVCITSPSPTPPSTHALPDRTRITGDESP